jgi:hypothetical protein
MQLATVGEFAKSNTGLGPEARGGTSIFTRDTSRNPPLARGAPARLKRGSLFCEVHPVTQRGLLAWCSRLSNEAHWRGAPGRQKSQIDKLPPYRIDEVLHTVRQKSHLDEVPPVAKRGFFCGVQPGVKLRRLFREVASAVAENASCAGCHRLSKEALLRGATGRGKRLFC